MILLKADHLVFKTSNGEAIPCAVETVVVELLGNSAENVDSHVIKHAAQAVLHYFKEEMNREEVSVPEFTSALEHVLKSLGLDVIADVEPSRRVVETDLQQLLNDGEKAWELTFFPRLRETLSRHMNAVPDVIRFKGLRPCVKHLVGAQRWCPRCEFMSDQIVGFLRECLQCSGAPRCALVVD